MPENLAVEFCCQCCAVAFMVQKTFYHLRFVQFHRIYYNVRLGILPTPCKVKNENCMDLRYRDTGTLLVTMLPELHLYVMLSVFVITKQFMFGHSTTEIEVKFYLQNCSWSTSAHWMQFFVLFCSFVCLLFFVFVFVFLFFFFVFLFVSNTNLRDE